MSKSDEDSTIVQPAFLMRRERRAIVLHQCRTVAHSLSAGVGHAACLQLAISVAGSPTAAAMLSAQIATASALSALLLSPTGAQLSDRIGRRPCMLVSAFVSAGSGITWRVLELLWSSWRPSSFKFVLASCTLSAVNALCGGSLAEQASLDDLLATRPAMSAAVASRVGFWSGTAGLVGTVVGAWLLGRNVSGGCNPARLCIGLALSLQLCGLLLTCCLRETLPAPARQRGGEDMWAWFCRPTNPLNNLSLMVRHSTRLRRLTVANLLFQVLNGNNALISTFALDQLHWTPINLSNFSAFQSALDMVAQGLVLPSLFLRCRGTSVHTDDRGSKSLAKKAGASGASYHEALAERKQKRGLQHAFFVGSVASISSCVLMSQCWRASRGRDWHKSSLMVAAEGLRAGIGRACIVTMRTMLLSTALEDCPTGTGVAELNAALLGMKTLCAGTGVVWVMAYRWCNEHGQPGGTWLLAAIGRCVVHAIVASCSLG